MTTRSALLENLNEFQRMAVTTEAQNCLVLAGAGSGKTRVLVHRIAWLNAIERIDCGRILAVTFTNKAAGEMKQRIAHWLGNDTRRMWMGTFHGLAHRFLRQHYQEAGLDKNFQIIDTDDQTRMVKRIIKAMNLDEKRFAPREVINFINARKDEGLQPKDLGGEVDPFRRQLVHIYASYQQECQRASLVDFGELLLRVYLLWRQYPDLRAHYQQRFTHILVDEFQDTNTIQYAWIKLLTGPQTHTMIVGDDDQSIYGWRGAKVENIHRFEHDFAGVQTVRLEQNYRSTATILNAANAVIAQNEMRLGKKLWTDGTQGQSIDLYQALNEKDEADMVANRIQKAQQNGKKLSDCAVLYRSNAQSRVLEEALLDAGIPYRIYGGMRFFERQEIRDALAYLRLMLHRDNDAAFERVINRPTRGIGLKTVDTLRSAAQEHGKTLFEAGAFLRSTGGLTARSATALQNFYTLIDSLENQCQGLSLPEQVKVVIEQSGLLNFYQSDKQEKSEARVENLQELISAASAFEREHELGETTGSALFEFLNRTALDADDAEKQQEQDQVQLMTLHASKGLEFPVVFLVGVEEGLFPSHNSLNDPSRLEEERRLCYVGMTRAREQLFMGYAQYRRLYGREMYNRISRFIEEIPEAYIEPIRMSVQVKPSARMASKNKFKEGRNGLRLGQQVIHPMFGQGVIRDFKGSGDTQQVCVAFRNTQTKWLMVTYANLQAIEEAL